MTAVTIVITGADKIAAKLGRLNIGSILRDPMTRAALRVQTDMQKYPPQRAGSAYRRTGTLGRRWTTPRVISEARRVEGSVGNNTSYGPFVQSSQFQARVHRGLWQTDAQVMERNIPVIVSEFEAAIRSALT